MIVAATLAALLIIDISWEFTKQRARDREEERSHRLLMKELRRHD